MELLLERRWCKKDYTIGILFVNGKVFSNTLEDTIRDINKDGKFNNGEYKISNETAIPYGEYEVVVSYSPKFKRELPLLLNVPNFNGIRIHRGNSNKDTSGCILVGENTQVGKVLNSSKYEQLLVKLLKDCKEKITIKII
jgi:hypothetical protein